MRSDFYYPSSGGGMIHGCRWEPAGKPKAVLQIVHGVAEHVLRYDHFAEFMAAQGFWWWLRTTWVMAVPSVTMV